LQGPIYLVFRSCYIEVVKKTFRYTNVFLLQPLMPPLLISEHKYEKRYISVAGLNTSSFLTFSRHSRYPTLNLLSQCRLGCRIKIAGICKTLFLSTPGLTKLFDFQYIKSLSRPMLFGIKIRNRFNAHCHSYLPNVSHY
jgi:hypothetical protein